MSREGVSQVCPAADDVKYMLPVLFDTSFYVPKAPLVRYIRRGPFDLVADRNTGIVLMKKATSKDEDTI